jgi:hypothetical protein
MNGWRYEVLSWAWILGSVGTFIWLTFFDGYNYNAWNWIIAVPINAFLGSIWPIYWLILNPLMN